MHIPYHFPWSPQILALTRAVPIPNLPRALLGYMRFYDQITAIPGSLVRAGSGGTGGGLVDTSPNQTKPSQTSGAQAEALFASDDNMGGGRGVVEQGGDRMPESNKLGPKVETQVLLATGDSVRHGAMHGSTGHAWGHHTTPRHCRFSCCTTRHTSNPHQRPHTPLSSPAHARCRLCLCSTNLAWFGLLWAGVFKPPPLLFPKIVYLNLS